MFKQDDHFSYKNCYQYGSCKSKKVIVIKSARINVLHILAEVITIFVSL